MAFPERRTANILLTVLFFAVVCAALYSARRIILIFVFAIFFAYLIDPVVKFLQRHSLFFRNLRGPAVIEVYLAFVVLIALLGFSFAPGVARNTVILVGAEVGGIVGIYLAVPLMASMCVIWRVGAGEQKEQGHHRQSEDDVKSPSSLVEAATT